MFVKKERFLLSICFFLFFGKYFPKTPYCLFLFYKNKELKTEITLLFALCGYIFFYFAHLR